ncbi:hypothetical protein MXB_43 [Myxobolus squamalis]|nr:hypothetical protein MXB_43 [Myxobolus squamalis]
MSENMELPTTNTLLQSFNDRLQELRLRRVNGLEKNYEVKKIRAEAEMKKIDDEKEAIKKGESYEANIRLTQSAIEIEEYTRRKKNADPEPGFADYATAALRRYNKNIRVLKPNLEKYTKLKALGRHVVDTTGPGLLDIFAFSEPSSEAVERVVNDVKKQRERREKLRGAIT